MIVTIRSKLGALKYFGFGKSEYLGSEFLKYSPLGVVKTMNPPFLTSLTNDFKNLSG